MITLVLMLITVMWEYEVKRSKRFQEIQFCLIESVNNTRYDKRSKNEIAVRDLLGSKLFFILLFLRRRLKMASTSDKNTLLTPCQPEIMTRKSISISPTPWKTQSPIRFSFFWRYVFQIQISCLHNICL